MNDKRGKESVDCSRSNDHTALQLTGLIDTCQEEVMVDIGTVRCQKKERNRSG